MLMPNLFIQKAPNALGMMDACFVRLYECPLRVDSCRYIGNFCERTSETLVDVHSPARPISSRVGIVQSEALRS
jgi:hypothetical protein